jgi:hypothetical protein
MHKNLLIKINLRSHFNRRFLFAHHIWAWANKSAAMEVDAKAEGLETNRRKQKGKKV